MKLIDGKKIAKKIEKNIKNSGKAGGLAVILVGDDPASHLYVSLKEKAAKRVGIGFEKFLFEESRIKNQESRIIEKIKKLNARKDITGIIVQLPLPKNLDTDKIIQTINPKKDADGFHPESTHRSPVLCATINALKETGADVENKKILMISKSDIFSKPFKKIFKNIIVSKPENIKQYSRDVDIIITAVGRPHYLKADMVRDGAIIIDIGISKKDKEVYGDTDPESLKDKSGWLTPVPGGIGPITVACLLKNVAK